jgi:hypothetical protein
MKLQFSRQVFEKAQISSSSKMRPVGAELYYEDRQADRYDEANSRFSQFCERA